ncbi:MAG: hypothetical protein RLZZ156_104 [Deinococcota bacterium]|jgi:arsenite oxidase small subunit
MPLTRRKILEHWWLAPVAAVAGFFTWLGIRSWNILIGKPNPSSTPKFIPAPKVRVARISDFPQVWDAVEFKLGTTPAILVRVQKPQIGGISVLGKHFIALSKNCTHLKCLVEYIKNPEITAMAYKYRPEFEHPVLGCACHFSAFDPEMAGKSVSGPALSPLARVQLMLQNTEIFAIGLET